MTSPNADGGNAKTTSWLRPAPQGPETTARLICFPHAGAGASSFNRWPEFLSPDIHLFRAQLPGREDNAGLPPFTRMSDLVPPLFEQVEPLLRDGVPMAIYGHSMGALVAFELVREMRRHGYGLPVCLFVSGRRAPHKPLTRPLLHAFTDEALADHLRRMGGTSPALLDRPRWRQHYFRIMRADLELSDIYHYADEPLLTCPIYAFLGADDDEMDRWIGKLGTSRRAARSHAPC
jgi:medium-chain acyl-[acyl-carrier-protein] hydrolase